MIYFDSDGIAFDWHGGIERYMPWSEFKELSSDKQRTVQSAIYKEEPNFFFNLEPIQQFYDLIEMVEGSGEQWAILTAIGSAHHDSDLVRESKIAAFAKHYGIDESKVIIVQESSDKVQYAVPGAILIDDYKLNCTQFTEAGGVGILARARTYNPKLVWMDIEEALDAEEELSNLKAVPVL